jgi:hypothetical protein
MLDTKGKLRSIEGVLKDTCLKLGVTEAQHIHGEGDDRRRKLLKLTIRALRDLDDSGGAALSMDSGPSLGDAQERAVAALVGFGNQSRGR